MCYYYKHFLLKLLTTYRFSKHIDAIHCAPKAAYCCTAKKQVYLKKRVFLNIDCFLFDVQGGTWAGIFMLAMRNQM